MKWKNEDKDLDILTEYKMTLRNQYAIAYLGYTDTLYVKGIFNRGRKQMRHMWNIWDNIYINSSHLFSKRQLQIEI